jgi:hypothetical protein
MTKMLFDSAFVLDGVRRTKDGYLAAYANVARTGVQRYKGYELGRPELDEVNVYRPPSEVFHKDALRSMAHRPVTLNHPSEVVDAKNWKRYAKGHTGDEILRDGDHVRVPMVLMDAEAIKAVEGGTRELSMGYSTDLKWTPGITEDGQRYDAVQTEIRANHLALVPVARGGSNLRFGDADDPSNNPRGTTNMKTIMIDGAPINVGDELAATLINNKLKSLGDGFEDMKKKKDDAEEEAKKAKAMADAATGEIAVLKKQVADAAITPEKLDTLVEERKAVTDAASSLLPKDFAFTGKKLEDIRRAAVAVHLGDAAVKDMSDDAVAGAFTALTASAPKGGTRELANAFRPRVADGGNTNDNGYGAYVKNLGDAWRGKASA